MNNNTWATFEMQKTPPKNPNERRKISFSFGFNPLMFFPPHKCRHDPFTAGKWSADLISGVRPSALCSSCCLCAACYSQPNPSSEQTLRDDGWKGQRSPSRPVRACLFRLLFPPPPCNFSASSFVHQTCGFVSMRRLRRPQGLLEK